MSKLFRTLGLVVTGFFALLATIMLATPGKVLAANETFTWKDYRTITASGGDLREPSDISIQKDQGDSGLTGDQIGIFAGSLVHRQNCTVTLQIIIYSNGTSLLWNPPPYGPGAGGSGSLPSCDGQIEGQYHNRWITIGGQRPPSPNAPEKPSEKLVRVTLNAPDPISRVPATVTITIKNSAGQTIDTKTATPVDDSGGANYPPDQTPAIFVSEFTLEPGANYKVCATYVIGPQCETFTKKKYEPLYLQYGAGFEMPHQQQIRAHVKIVAKRACGASYNHSATEVVLKKPDGTTVTQSAPAVSSNPRPEEAGALCTVNIELTSTADFNNMPPGRYEACATGAPCVSFEKKPGELAEVTLTIQDDYVIPPDQPVCTTGTGFGGFLAWILCPAMQLIANVTSFVEKNIIVPYLSVSPLQINGPVYTVWQNIRNLANVAFIVAFFFIIFSQATSIGISNYGIKKLLPKLALVAVGTNLSFFLVAFIIDAFNIFGAGVAQLVMSAINASANTGPTADPLATFLSITTIAGGLTIAIIMVNAGPVLSWLFTLIGIAFLIILVAVVVLVIRQMIIILLVMVSPLAFVAWLLPNTEKYFARWRQLLIQLLIMYPMIILLFAVGKIVAALINSGTFQMGTSAVAHNVANTLFGGLPFVAQAASGALTGAIQVGIGFFAQAAPLIFLPASFVWSGKIMGGVFRVLQQRGRSAGRATKEGLGKQIKPYWEQFGLKTGLTKRRLRKDFKKQQQEREVKRAQSLYLSQYAQGNERFRRSAAGVGGQAGANRVLASAQSTFSRLEKEELDNAMALLTRQMKQIGVDKQTFAKHFKNYLETGDETAPAGFKFSEHPEIARAALMSAADQGEVLTLEAARLSSRVNQSDVDSIINMNVGKLKEAGGFHLTSNFSLGYGRSNSNPDAMTDARLKAFAEAQAEHIPDMKYSVVESIAQSLQDPAVVSRLNPRTAAAIKTNVQQALTTPSVSSRVTDKSQFLKSIDQIL